MTATAALGRGLFSFLFIASALEKWRALRVDGADAPIMTSVAPALRAVKATTITTISVLLPYRSHTLPDRKSVV